MLIPALHPLEHTEETNSKTHTWGTAIHAGKTLNVLNKHLKEFHGSLNGDIIYIIEL